MIDASNQAEYFKGYHAAFDVAVRSMEQTWHQVWEEYHQYYTRRRDGSPLRPSTDVSTAGFEPGANTLDEDQVLAVNHIQSIIRTIVAATLNRNPEFSLDPQFAGFDAPHRARFASLALNNEWRKRNFNRPIRDAYVDSLIYGRGWTQNGWHAAFTRPIEGTDQNAQLRDAMKAVTELSRKGTSLGRRPMTPEEVQRQMQKFGGKLLVEDHPTLSRVSPFDMFFDPMAIDPADARWIARRWRCPLGFAKQNREWKASERKSLSAGSFNASMDPGDDSAGTESGEYQGKDVTWIVDFYDLADGTWCQFAPGGAGFLRSPEDIPFIFGQPFCWIDNIDDTGNAQPISEVEVLWPHQRLLTSLAGELGVDRVQSRLKIIASLEHADKLRPVFESSEQGGVVGVELAPGERAEEMFWKFQAESRSGELMNQIGMGTNWMTQSSGVSDYIRGGSTSGQTATGVNAMQMSAANYMGEKAGRLRDFVEANAARTLSMMQTYCNLEYFISTKVPDPQDPDNPNAPLVDATVAYERKHIAGSYRVIVSADSTETKSPQAKQARAQAIASTAMPFIQSGIVDPAQLFRYVMKEGFDMADPSVLLTQQAMTPAGAPPPEQAGGPQPMGGISMTPGSGAGQLGASVAAERTATGDVVPQPEG
jgi:hypothetical protein